MSTWGNDGPVLGSDDDKTKKGRKVLGDRTFNQVGTWCKHCKAEGGDLSFGGGLGRSESGGPY